MTWDPPWIHDFDGIKSVVIHITKPRGSAQRFRSVVVITFA